MRCHVTEMVVICLLAACWGVRAEVSDVPPTGDPLVSVQGMVTSAIMGTTVDKGMVEIRWPGHDDQFEAVTAEIGDDGAYAVALPGDCAPLAAGELTLSVHAKGFTLREVPLPPPSDAGPVRLDLSLTPATLDGILDIFACCVLSWSVLTVMLPAFLLGAAITVFVPSQYILRYLGPDAPKPAAYGAAAGSGIILSLCSCNVVPLFVSIWRSGAGIGPAFTFLYAGPAINLIAVVFTCRVIGLSIGLWRLAAVALLSVVVGLIMARVFRSEGAGGRVAAMSPVYVGPPAYAVVAFVGLLAAMLVVGSMEFAAPVQIAASGSLTVALLLVAWRGIGWRHTRQWLEEVGRLLKLVLPILLPAVFLFGYLAQKVPVSSTRGLVGHNGLPQNALSALFGAFMYFPILTETPFVKASLKVLNAEVGPSMALLLTAPGLSLPGMVIVSREIGWRKVATYVGTIVCLASVAGLMFGSKWGAYLCSCRFE